MLLLPLSLSSASSSCVVWNPRHYGFCSLIKLIILNLFAFCLVPEVGRGTIFLCPYPFYFLFVSHFLPLTSIFRSFFYILSLVRILFSFILRFLLFLLLRLHPIVLHVCFAFPFVSQRGRARKRSPYVPNPFSFTFSPRSSSSLYTSFIFSVSWTIKSPHSSCFCFNSSFSISCIPYHFTLFFCSCSPS